MRRGFWGLLCGLGLVSGSLGAVPQPFTVDHLKLLRRVDTPRISPDGSWVAYAVSAPDLAQDEHRSEIRLLSTRSGTQTSVGEGSSPAWSPDSRRLAFERTTEGVTAVWLYNLEGGKVEKLVDLTLSDHFLGHEADLSFAWSPQGTHLAFFSTEPVAETAGKPGPTPRVVDRTQFKTRKGFSPNRPLHLWVVEAKTGAKPRQLTTGRFDDHSLSWSPDGRRLVFVSNRSSQPDENYSDDLFMVEVEGRDAAAPRRLTDTAGTEMAPAFSPDGRWIAYLGTSRPFNTKDSQVEDPHIFVLPTAGGQALDLSASLDRRPDELLWHPDSKSLWLVFDNQGRRPIGRLLLPTPQEPSPRVLREVEGFAFHSQLSVDAAGRWLVYLRSESQAPAEVWMKDVTRGTLRGLTRENHLLQLTAAFQGVDSIRRNQPDGSFLEAFLLKPIGWKTGVRAPLVLWVHGGPHGMAGHVFSERLQLLAARGFAVLIANPRGSTGYGQAFGDGTLNDWGGGDYQDLMSLLDQTLTEYPWIESDRLGVGGWSYGGYMTNWILTQSDRFKVGVSGAGLSNLVSFYGTSLYSDLLEVEFGGKPWEGDRFARLWERSPLQHIIKVKAPLLLLHGENDHDVPIGQAEEMYTALKRRGMETVLVAYPGEGHSIRRPSFQRDMYRRMIDWFAAVLKPVQPILKAEEKAPPPPVAAPPPPPPPARPAKPPKHLFKEPEASAAPTLEPPAAPRGRPLLR